MSIELGISLAAIFIALVSIGVTIFLSNKQNKITLFENRYALYVKIIQPLFLFECLKRQLNKDYNTDYPLSVPDYKLSQFVYDFSCNFLHQIYADKGSIDYSISEKTPTMIFHEVLCNTRYVHSYSAIKFLFSKEIADSHRKVTDAVYTFYDSLLRPECYIGTKKQQYEKFLTECQIFEDTIFEKLDPFMTLNKK